MSLYDSYQLANSRAVRKYQGSVAPELIKVADVMQQRYDTVEEGMDYVSRFMNSMEALPQDRKALQDWSKQYKDKLGQLSQRKDLENAVREATMLARDVPQGYAPFANRMKQFQGYRDELMKRVEAGKISAETAEKAIGRSLHYDRGLQLNPETGQYTGSFSGAPIRDDINLTEKIDKWMQGNDPKKTGYKAEKVNGMWIFKDGQNREVRDPNVIARILHGAAAADEDYQSWLKQEIDLNTYNRNYQVDDEMLDKAVDDNGTTIRAMIEPYTKRGYTPEQALRAIDASGIERNMMKKMLEYAIPKFEVNNVTTEHGISTNENYWKQKTWDDEHGPGIGVSATIYQPEFGTTLDTPGKLQSETAKHDAAAKETYMQYLAWTNKNGVKVVDAKGNPASPYQQGAQFFDAKGNNVTGQALQFIEAQQQAARMSQELTKRKEDLMKKAGIKLSETDLKEAQKAYDEAYAKTSYTDSYGMKVSYNEEIRRRNAKAAYDEVLRAKNPDEFSKYEKLLADDAKQNMVTVGLKRFNVTKYGKDLNAEVETLFNGLVNNLDKGGIENGTIGLEWGAGDKVGQVLEADDYKKIAGKATYAGSGLVNGRMMMFFNIASEGKDNKDKSGVIVRMPAFTGITENLIREGSINQAQLNLIQQFENGVHNGTGKGEVTLPVSYRKEKDGYVPDKKVTLKRVSSSDVSSFEAPPGTPYILYYHTGDGKTISYPINSPADAAQHVLYNLKTTR